MKRRQKAGFFGPDKLQNHTNEGKEIARRKKGGEENEKNMVVILVFPVVTLDATGPFCGKMFSKLWLDINKVPAL